MRLLKQFLKTLKKMLEVKIEAVYFAASIFKFEV